MYVYLNWPLSWMLEQTVKSFNCTVWSSNSSKFLQYFTFSLMHFLNWIKVSKFHISKWFLVAAINNVFFQHTEMLLWDYILTILQRTVMFTRKGYRKSVMSQKDRQYSVQPWGVQYNLAVVYEGKPIIHRLLRWWWLCGYLSCLYVKCVSV